MIPYSRIWVNHFKIRNHMQHSHSKRGTQCMFSPICLPLFSDQLLFGLWKIKKVFSGLVIGLSAKACHLRLVIKDLHESWSSKHFHLFTFFYQFFLVFLGHRIIYSMETQISFVLLFFNYIIHSFLFFFLFFLSFAFFYIEGFHF